VEEQLNSPESAQEDPRTRLLALIERIPIFSGLSAEDRSGILKLCTKITLERGDILCHQGDSSGAMFILLVGKLAVRIANSATIASIVPVTSIGEMGVFTGESRTATVEAMEKSALLRLDAVDLNNLIESRPALGVSVMRKVIRTLSERVSADNIRIREFQNYLIELETGGN
jgi:CRP-like cAMP-binding protein